MSGLKPIEAGCLAVIFGYHPSVDGTEVNVGSFLGEIKYAYGCDRWSIEQAIPAVEGIGGAVVVSVSVSGIRGRYLMRIDSNEELFKAEQEQDKGVVL